MRCRKGRIICLILLLGLFFSKNVTATSTGQKLQNAQNEKTQAENKLDRIQENVDKLNSDRVSLQTYMDELNEQLDLAYGKLAEIDTIRQTKEEEIEQAKKDIEEAETLQVTRYEEMKQRIRFMYEKGNESYLTLFFSARSFSDMLNKADYIEMINQYDRDMLQKYQDTEREIKKKKSQLEDSVKTLAVLEKEASDSVAEIFAETKEASKNMAQYREEIQKQEEKALAYEKQISEAETDIAVLTAQYKEELRISTEAQALVSRDLSDVVFNAGDLDVMAAIIECEAGGESYTGKVAVGAVVLNRVRSPKFPSTVLEVIMQNRQFSPVASGRFALVLARGANESCYQAAQDAMAGASPVGNCLFFRTPIPGLTGMQIGGHIFY